MFILRPFVHLIGAACSTWTRLFRTGLDSKHTTIIYQMIDTEWPFVYTDFYLLLVIGCGNTRGCSSLFVQQCQSFYVV